MFTQFENGFLASLSWKRRALLEKPMHKKARYKMQDR
jgi:hypothetical protein